MDFYKNDITIESNFKPSEENVIIGIDEAGRGPVLGHLVYGALISSQIAHSFRDSKMLSENARENNFELICNEYSYAFIALHPKYLTAEMQKRSLNDISYDAVIKLIKTIIASRKYTIKKIYLDALGPDKKYTEVLQKNFPGISFIVEKKADSKYPIVSGASVVAKVNRDRILKKWPLVDKNCGSGYPGDEITIQWLKRNFCPVFGFPNIARFKWATVQKMFHFRDSKALKSNSKLFLEK